MKTIVYEQYGAPEVLKMEDRAKPVPKDSEILVKVHTSTVTAGAMLLRKGRHPDSGIFTFIIRLTYGWNKPKKEVLGYEFSGEVVEVGAKVSRFSVGDEVFGTTTGLKQGAYAEYVAIPEQWKAGVIAKKPKSLTHEEAAALPIGAMTALHLLRKREWSGKEKALIYGASGSVGTYAVQLASHFGSSVTAVCSGANLELVKELGADQAIDYRSDEYANLHDSYDVVFDAVGKTSKKKCASFLKGGGDFLSVTSLTSETDDKLEYLINLVEKGDLRPYIDKVYPLDKTADAHRYSDSGHKKGNVVVKII